MKKILLFSALLTGCLTILQAQTKLCYSTHAIQGMDNNMSYCQYSDPGVAGENQKWDFSSLVFVTPFTGYVSNSDFSDLKSSFPKANTVLTEFNSHFLLNVTRDKVEQYGYASADGNTKITYDIPFVKMKFPFGYGDIYSGALLGKYSSSGISGDITGDYTVEADGYGTLILPGNVVFNEVLRVKTLKNYVNKMPGTNQVVNIETIRWYNSANKYPLLVLTKFTTTSGDCSSTNYQAAYNSQALKASITDGVSFDDANMSVFPNPVTTNLNLLFYAPAIGTIDVEIYDASGRRVRSFQKEIYVAGNQQYDFSDELPGLKPGTYMMTVVYGDARINKEFTFIGN